MKMMRGLVGKRSAPSNNLDLLDVRRYALRGVLGFHIDHQCNCYGDVARDWSCS
jgi:hypothetical protein